MTIGTSNVSFSSINTEKSNAAGETPSNSNLSLNTMGTSTMILNPSNSRQTYTLTDSLTLTTQDSSVADNMNLASAPTEASEFKSLALDGIQFSQSTQSQLDFHETINHQNSISNNGCFVTARLSAELWAQRVGNDLVWYIDEGDWYNIGTHRREGSTGWQGNKEVARLAGVGTSPTVSVAITQLENFQGGTNSGGVFGSTSVSHLGSSSATMASTNTKWGYEVIYSALGECVSGAHVRQRFQVDYTFNHPSYQNRVFTFFMALRGTYSTSSFTCC